MLEDMIAENVNNFKFAFLPHFTGVNIRVAKINSSDSLSKLKCSLLNKLSTYCYGENEDTLEGVVSKMLIENKVTISIAESCTGGLLSKKLTDFDGSSKYFLGSVIAYSDKIKNEILEIPKKILEKEGAVSSDVALRMSENVARKFNSTLGVSITGISGPTGYSNKKELGLYYVSIKYKSIHFYKKFIFNVNDRLIHRSVAVNTALNMIRKQLIESDE